jgi:hypothetical protein
MSESPSKKTVGEELFLVHLSRVGNEGPGEKDLDADKKHHESDMTVGEELWRIHCKRSSGMVLESDEGPKVKENKKAKKRSMDKKSSDGYLSTPTTKVIHLRNRDVAVP